MSNHRADRHPAGRSCSAIYIPFFMFFFGLIGAAIWFV